MKARLLDAQNAGEKYVPVKLMEKIKAADALTDSVTEKAKTFYEKKKAPKKLLAQFFKDLKQAMDEAQKVDKVIMELLPADTPVSMDHSV